ncbi:probable magnesium transporter MgtE [Coccomyxa sp. Obi]|nr:probable magnesium transporter MgtE [Coccomyxa sp. Obi]
MSKSGRSNSSPTGFRIWANGSWSPGGNAKKRMCMLSAVERGNAVSDYSAEESTADLCDSGLPDPEVCDVLHLPPKETAVVSEAWSRGRWLLGLLVLQSTSSMVLDLYQDLLRNHLVITLFLTMLVGAGGNAGNQSAIKVIRGLATGRMKLTAASLKQTLGQQSLVGLLLAVGLTGAGFARVYVSEGSLLDSCAISASLFCIVMTSVLTGTVLPFGLAFMGVDPANAGTTIQVWCDITGCLITCVTCKLILDQLAHMLPLGS